MAEQLDALLKKYGPSTLSFEEWKQAANQIRFFGQTKEEIFDILGYPVEPDDTPIKVTYKGDKSGYDRRTGQRITQAQKRTTKTTTQTVGKDVYNKGVVAPKFSGLEEHHKRVVDVYAPFFEGLSNKEAKELAQWFVDEGAPLGNVAENLEALSPEEHNKLHQWLKQNYIQSETGKPLLNLKNLSLNERFVPALTFLEQIQPAADEQLDKLKLLRKSAKGLAIAGAAAPLAVGLPMSAAETAQRYQIAQETQDPIDAAQTVLSGTSFAGDAISAFPPAAPLGEGVSTFGDVSNTLIDIIRENPEQAKAFVKGAAKNVAESLIPDPIGDLQKTGGAVQSFITQGLNAFLPKSKPSSKPAQPAKPYTPSIVPPTTDFTSKSSPAAYTTPGLSEFLKGI